MGFVLLLYVLDTILGIFICFPYRMIFETENHFYGQSTVFPRTGQNPGRFIRLPLYMIFDFENRPLRIKYCISTPWTKSWVFLSVSHRGRFSKFVWIKYNISTPWTKSWAFLSVSHYVFRFRKSSCMFCTGMVLNTFVVNCHLIFRYFWEKNHFVVENMIFRRIKMYWKSFF